MHGSPPMPRESAEGKTAPQCGEEPPPTANTAMAGQGRPCIQSIWQSCHFVRCRCMFTESANGRGNRYQPLPLAKQGDPLKRSPRHV